MDPKLKAKFLWHCRRGMLELDLILQKFVTQKLETLSPEQLNTFDELLSCTDPEIYSWFMGITIPPTKELQNLVAIINAST